MMIVNDLGVGQTRSLECMWHVTAIAEFGRQYNSRDPESVNDSLKISDKILLR